MFKRLIWNKSRHSDTWLMGWKESLESTHSFLQGKQYLSQGDSGRVLALIQLVAFADPWHSKLSCWIQILCCIRHCRDPGAQRHSLGLSTSLAGSVGSPVKMGPQAPYRNTPQYFKVKMPFPMSNTHVWLKFWLNSLNRGKQPSRCSAAFSSPSRWYFLIKRPSLNHFE